MRPFALVACLVATAALGQSPPRVASLDWMSGTWVHEANGERVSENWLGPGHGLMVGANLTLGPGTRRFFEFMRVADTERGFSYFASPGGRPAVEFPLKEQGERRVVFEDPARDYPRRILYWREGEALRARIEGMKDGAAKSEEWRFERK